MKVFAFPFAGGSAAFYNDLEQCLKPDLDLVKLEYPGHGMRMKESLCQSFEELVADLYPTIQETLRRNGQEPEPYALLGYSMGCIVVVEMLRRILNDYIPLPHHVFLAAHEPHAKVELAGITGDEADALLMERTKRFGGIPENLLASRTFWRMYLPIYRADYTMLWKYRFDEMDLRTSVSATCFYSESDTPLTEMLKWKAFFAGEMDFVAFEGNHFFIQDHCQEIADIIKERCLG